MSNPKQQPSAEGLLAIAEAAEGFADAAANALPFWDTSPEANPITVLARIHQHFRHARHTDSTEKEAVQVAESDWECEYFDAILNCECRMVATMWHLRQLLVKVWPSYLGPMDDLNTWCRQDREPMPSTAVVGWPCDVEFCLKGFQRDLAAIEDIFAVAIRTDTLPSRDEFSSVGLIESIRISARELRRVVENRRRPGIPLEERTLPMSYRKAAMLMGKGDSKKWAEWLSKSVSDGSIPCDRTTSRQKHIFSKRYFPEEKWPQILPETPNDPK